MSRISYLDCPHRNQQDYTEYCLDCGYNIYTTKEEYLKDLEEQLSRKGQDSLTLKIRAREEKLGITNG